MLPFEMNRFWPFNTHSLRSSLAVVARFPASLPASGSVIAQAPRRSPLARGTSQASFCASEPNHMRDVSLRDVWTEPVVRTEDEPPLSSSPSSTHETYSTP